MVDVESTQKKERKNYSVGVQLAEAKFCESNYFIADSID